MPKHSMARAGLLLSLIAALAAASLSAQTAGASSAPHAFVRVDISPSLPSPVSGRLLIFIKQGKGDKEVNIDQFHPAATWVAAEEVQDLTPGSSIEVDVDQTAFPEPFSKLPAADYEAQALLDTGHTYNYSGPGPKDWVSNVVPLPGWTPLTHPEPLLVLDHAVPANARAEAAVTKAMAGVRSDVAQKEEFVSPLLSRFWGHPVTIRAWVILPPNYTAQPQERYPTVYFTHGFGGNLAYSLVQGMTLRGQMEKNKMPPMIWVMLDESIPQGTHEFADSVNNGPWGTALTTEFLPYLEHKYRMGARRDQRFLNGHSSGGWATLQLEVNYPAIFGGTWSTSPDPSDFHDFTGPDLYLPHANLYQKPDGTPWPLIRQNGKALATLEQFAKLEAVLGPYGGQFSSFDWVFSPRGPSGAPEPMFDRKTGAVNEQVVAYWRDHYDLAHIVETNWGVRGKDLKGRIHLFVGTADTFYLDGSAHKFEEVLNRLGAEPHFSYLPGKTHFDLYTNGDEKYALFGRIAAEMYAVAKPHENWKPN